MTTAERLRLRKTCEKAILMVFDKHGLEAARKYRDRLLKIASEKGDDFHFDAKTLVEDPNEFTHPYLRGLLVGIAREDMSAYGALQREAPDLDVDDRNMTVEDLGTQMSDFIRRHNDTLHSDRFWAAQRWLDPEPTSSRNSRSEFNATSMEMYLGPALALNVIDRLKNGDQISPKDIEDFNHALYLMGNGSSTESNVNLSKDAYLGASFDQETRDAMVGLLASCYGERNLTEDALREYITKDLGETAHLIGARLADTRNTWRTAVDDQMLSKDHLEYDLAASDTSSLYSDSTGTS